MADHSQRLAIVVTAQDLASGKLGKVRSELAGMGTSGKIASVGLGGAMLAVNKGEQALGNFKNRLTSLAAPLAMIGLTGGLFTLGGALTAGISKAADFGETVDKAMSMTGLGVAKASALSSALAYVGVNGDAVVKMLGMAEKNLGLLTTASGKKTGIEKAQEFQKTYGLSILDTNNKVVDANELLLRSADLYTSKTIPASQKAITLSKIYGKSWQSNIEIFEMGRTKIAAAEAEMAAAGMTMTAQNMKDWEKYRDATRAAGGAVSGLEMQLGLLVMPDITAGLTAFTSYLSTHREDVKRFFSDGLHMAEAFGGFITGTVVPAISTIAGAASGVWNSIPGPMKDLLVKGFVADRTMKFFFGMSPIHAVVSLAEGAIQKGFSSLVGGIFTKGSLANPMIVKDISGGLGGGGQVSPTEAAAGGGAAAIAAGAAIVAAGAAVTWLSANGLRDQRNAIAGASNLTNTQALAVQLSKMDPANRQMALSHGAQAEFTREGTTYQAALAAAQAAVTAYAKGGGAAGLTQAPTNAFRSGERGDVNPFLPTQAQTNAFRSGERGTVTSHMLSSQITAALGKGTLGANGVAQANALRSAFQESVAPSQRSMTSAMSQMKEMQARYLAQGDTKLAASIGADLRALQAKLTAAINATTTAIQLKQFIATGILGSGSLTGHTPVMVSPVGVRDVSTATISRARAGPDRKIL